MGQENYEHEVRMRMTKTQLKIMKASDIADLTDRELLLVESAYRRGYYHGFYSCLESVIDGIPIRKLQKFVSGVLFKWRCKRHGGRFEEPIWPARSNKFKKGETT